MAPIQFGEVVPVLRVLLIVGALAMAVQWKNEALERFGLWAPARQAAAAALIVMAIVTLGVFDGADFIYFQF